MIQFLMIQPSCKPSGKISHEAKVYHLKQPILSNKPTPTRPPHKRLRTTLLRLRCHRAFTQHNLPTQDTRPPAKPSLPTSFLPPKIYQAPRSFLPPKTSMIRASLNHPIPETRLLPYLTTHLLQHHTTHLLLRLITRNLPQEHASITAKQHNPPRLHQRLLDGPTPTTQHKSLTRPKTTERDFMIVKRPLLPKALLRTPSLRHRLLQRIRHVPRLRLLLFRPRVLGKPPQASPLRCFPIRRGSPI